MPIKKVINTQSTTPSHVTRGRFKHQQWKIRNTPKQKKLVNDYIRLGHQVGETTNMVMNGKNNIVLQALDINNSKIGSVVPKNEQCQ